MSSTVRHQTSLRSDPLLDILKQQEAAIRHADDRFNASHDGEGCQICNSRPHVPFSMAFQPIVNVAQGTVVAYEALARGPRGEPAASVLDHTLHNYRYSIDQRCREKAIAISSTLGILNSSADLSVNFYPNAVYEPKQCLKRTFNMAQSVHFPLSRIIFEITEVEQVHDHDHLRSIMNEYRSHGLRVAIDDFGTATPASPSSPSSSPTSSRSTVPSLSTSTSVPPADPSSNPSSRSAASSTSASSPRASNANRRCTPSATLASTPCKATSSPAPPSKPSRLGPLRTSSFARSQWVRRDTQFPY
jgi:EAL domain-containing protein (putative c-di-GMP-specific phosphodiesterase class I)